MNEKRRRVSPRANSAVEEGASRSAASLVVPIDTRIAPLLCSTKKRPRSHELDDTESSPESTRSNFAILPTKSPPTSRTDSDKTALNPRRGYSKKATVIKDSDDIVSPAEEKGKRLRYHLDPKFLKER